MGTCAGNSTGPHADLVMSNLWVELKVGTAVMVGQVAACSPWCLLPLSFPAVSKTAIGIAHPPRVSKEGISTFIYLLFHTPIKLLKMNFNLY